MARGRGWLAALRGWPFRRAPRAEEGATEGLDAETLGAVVAQAADRLGRQVVCRERRWSRTGVELLWLDGDAPYIARVAVRQAASERVRANADALAALAPLARARPALAGRVPEVVWLGEVAGHVCSIESRLPGASAARRCARPDGAAAVEGEAARFLAALHSGGREGVIDEARWHAAIEPGLAALGRLVPAGRVERAFGRLVDGLREALIGARVPHVACHGNFWCGNLLWDEASGLAGVIDWDGWRPDGLPLTDLLYLRVRSRSLMSRSSFGEALLRCLADEPAAETDDRITAEYCGALDLPAGLIAPLTYVAWIEQIELHARYGTRTLAKRRWLKRNVLNVLEHAGGMRRP